MAVVEWGARRAKRKGTPSHYRERIDRLKRRADYLRQMLTDRPERSETSKHHIAAEISALDWAVSMLEPWFAKEESGVSPAAEPK